MASDDVTPAGFCAPPQAGFVQLMLATVRDRAVVQRLEEETADGFARWRPDAVGAYRVWLPGKRMLAVDYFTSEEEARAGERREPPPEVTEAMPRWFEQMRDVQWFDLQQHWIARSVLSAGSGWAD